MDTAAARFIENLVDHGAAACLGGSAAFAAHAAIGPIAAPVTAGALAYVLGWGMLIRIRPAIGARPQPAPMPHSDVAAPASDARVVRLFDPAAMPNPRPAPAAIGWQRSDSPLAAPPDASQALRDALSELRQSLR